MSYLLLLLFACYLFYEYNFLFYRFLLTCIGFKIDDTLFDNLPNQLIFIGTHTSIVDFFIGTFIYYGYLHKNYTNYILMKKEFEKYTSSIFYNFDSKLKIIPVDKEKKGLIKKITEELKFKNNYLLFISPEGTRNYTETIKSGYWSLAKELNIDVVFIGIDFYKKTFVLEPPRKVFYNWEIEKELFKKSAEKYAPLLPEKCSFYKKTN